MTCEIKDIPELWQDLVKVLLEETTAFALGVFDAGGRLHYANQGMKILLAVENGSDSPGNRLVNPTLETLLARTAQETPVFDGVLTTGDGREHSRSTLARVYRNEDQLLIAAEYDVAEMDRLNSQMTGMNREINNLQRQLIKEKTLLEHTLKELRETQAMLIHAEKMAAMGQLVAGVAHEINNPMGFVISNLHSLKEAFLDFSDAYTDLEARFLERAGDAGKEILADLREVHDLEFILEDFPDLLKGSMEGSTRVKKIVQDLRTFSRLDEAEKKTVDLSENLRSTLTLVDSELRKRDISVKLEMESLSPIECYPSDLNQVFMNLIVNAAQAMEEGGELTIFAREDESWVYLDFADTGPGIPADVQKKIFDPFFTTKPVGSGTGLGLSLAYQIIAQKHGGQYFGGFGPGLRRPF